MKVLMLVLSSQGGSDNCYSGFVEQWLRYANSNPSIDVYLYLADNTIENKYDLSGNILRIKRNENWDDILDKTFDAFDYFKDKIDSYDWVCRPNMSAFIHFDKYLQYLSKLPESVQVEGNILQGGGIVYPSGAGYSFRAPLLKLFLENRRQTWYVDDMTIGKILYENNIPIHRREHHHSCVNSTTFNTFFLELKGQSTQFQYRFKTEKRSDDVEHYRQFVDSILNPVNI